MTVHIEEPDEGRRLSDHPSPPLVRRRAAASRDVLSDLQRHAGNAAVTHLLQRQVTPTPTVGPGTGMPGPAPGPGLTPGQHPAQEVQPEPATEADLQANYDRVIARELTALLQEYQQLPVEIPWADPAPSAPSTGSTPSTAGPPESVTAATPYWINTAGRRAARTARTAGAPARERAVFNRLSWAVRHGKARPSEVAAAAQEAVSAGVVRGSGGRWPPAASDINAWLVRWGIGVDCSGFVYQALERAGGALEQEGQEGLERPLGGTITNVGTGGLARPGARITVPNELRVGDLVYLAGEGGVAHIRIIEAIRTEDAALVYTTVESSSTEHTPGATGPTRREWRFPNAAVRANLQRWDGSRWVAAGARDRRASYRRRLAGPAPGS